MGVFRQIDRKQRDGVVSINTRSSIRFQFVDVLHADEDIDVLRISMF